MNRNFIKSVGLLINPFILKFHGLPQRTKKSISVEDSHGFTGNDDQGATALVCYYHGQWRTFRGITVVRGYEQSGNRAQGRIPQLEGLS